VRAAGQAELGQLARSSSETPAVVFSISTWTCSSRDRVSLDREVADGVGHPARDGLVDDPPRDAGEHQHDQDRERDLAGRDARGDRVEPRVHQHRDSAASPIQTWPFSQAIIVPGRCS
jgi:hypothetical protein